MSSQRVNEFIHNKMLTAYAGLVDPTTGRLSDPALAEQTIADQCAAIADLGISDHKTTVALSALAHIHVRRLLNNSRLQAGEQYDR